MAGEKVLNPKTKGKKNADEDGEDDKGDDENWRVKSLMKMKMMMIDLRFLFEETIDEETELTIDRPGKF